MIVMGLFHNNVKSMSPPPPLCGLHIITFLYTSLTTYTNSHRMNKIINFPIANNLVHFNKFAQCANLHNMPKLKVIFLYILVIYDRLKLFCNSIYNVLIHMEIFYPPIFIKFSFYFGELGSALGLHPMT